MPTSTYVQTPYMVDYLLQINPKSILDIGVGNGKMGFIARDILDVMYGERYLKKDWEIRLDGIEIYPAYIQDHQRFIYDDIFIGDAFNIIENLGSYDLIILGDVLEHFAKDKAWEFLDKCFQHCNNSILLNLPLGEKWKQGDIYGNKYETHLSFWQHKEFENFSPEIKLFEFAKIGLYGIIVIKSKNYISFKNVVESEKLIDSHSYELAEKLLKESTSLNPNNIIAFLLLVEIFLKEKRIDDARTCLENLIKHNPNSKEGHALLNQLLQRGDLQTNAN